MILAQGLFSLISKSCQISSWHCQVHFGKHQEEARPVRPQLFCVERLFKFLDELSVYRHGKLASFWEFQVHKVQGMNLVTWSLLLFNTTCRYCYPRLKWAMPHCCPPHRSATRHLPTLWARCRAWTQAKYLYSAASCPSNIFPWTNTVWPFSHHTPPPGNYPPPQDVWKLFSFEVGDRKVPGGACGGSVGSRCWEGIQLTCPTPTKKFSGTQRWRWKQCIFFQGFHICLLLLFIFILIYIIFILIIICICCVFINL